MSNTCNQDGCEHCWHNDYRRRQYSQPGSFPYDLPEGHMVRRCCWCGKEVITKSDVGTTPAHGMYQNG